jgi:ABC-type branched-subunit amino acid transport system substrate-binding protein
VNLGLLFPDTGDSASLFAPFRAGVDARLGAANADGGVNGRKVTYTWADDASRPARNLVAARHLVEGAGTFGIIESTTAASGSAAYLHNLGVPVTGTSLETPWATYPNMFSYSTLIANGASVSTWGDFISAHGGHTAVIAQARFSATSMSFAREMTESLRGAGVHVVGTVDLTSPVDAAHIGQEIKATGANVLVGAVTGASFGQAIAGARGEGAHLDVILSPTGYDQSLLRLFGPAFAGVYLFVDYLPFEVDQAAHQAFLNAMTAYSPETQPPTGQAALSGWISADLFLRGLAAAGPCPTRARFIAGLRAVHDYGAGGLLPAPLDLTTSFGQISRCYTFLQVSADGARFVVVPPVPRCGTKLD